MLKRKNPLIPKGFKGFLSKKVSPEGFIYVIHINTYIRLYGILLILLSYILIFIYVYVLLHNSNVGNMSYKKTLKIYYFFNLIVLTKTYLRAIFKVKY